MFIYVIIRVLLFSYYQAPKEMASIDQNRSRIQNHIIQFLLGRLTHEFLIEIVNGQVQSWCGNSVQDSTPDNDGFPPDENHIVLEI
jgi:hypothetical protein